MKIIKFTKKEQKKKPQPTPRINDTIFIVTAIEDDGLVELKIGDMIYTFQDKQAAALGLMLLSAARIIFHKKD